MAATATLNASTLSRLSTAPVDNTTTPETVDHMNHKNDAVSFFSEELPVPKGMNICILVVGTHGDINPFLGLADRFVEAGHFVRVATHRQHRKLVLMSGHDYYPLAGDPTKLSEWMVQTGGTVLGEAKNLNVVPEKTAMAREIIASTWPAVTEPSPDDIDSKPFEADAVIANPPVFGHIHVCEALGIPLHIMFPQPWYYGTKEFPHPLLGMSYDKPSGISVKGFSRVEKMNFRSYALFETVAFSSMEAYVNIWRRKTLDIPVVHFGMGAATLIPDSKVPFSAMWSPSFVPKPEDWPDHCRVVGTFRRKELARASQNFNTEPFQDLTDWLREGEKPIFVGFGSMVIKDPTALAAIIMAAADIAKCRVVVQSGWSKLDVSASPRCHNVGPCPHDWLLPQMSAVVHHGGAGTTAAGLHHALPTFVCPFFGDQFMWGAMIERAQVGPAPCPVRDLTAEILALKFVELQQPEMKQRVEEMAAKMLQEDGIQGGLEHFFHDLPKHNMLCDVSLVMGEAKIAKYVLWGPKLTGFSAQEGLKVSVEVAAAFKSLGFDPIYGSSSKDYFKQWYGQVVSGLSIHFRRHSVTQYALGRPRTWQQGCAGGVFGFFRHILLAVIQPCYRSDTLARSHGMVGCLFGLLASPFYAAYSLIRAVVVLFDRWITGFSNSFFGTSKKTTFDPKRLARVRETGVISKQLDEIVARGVPKRRQKEVLRAAGMAARARRVFLKADPFWDEASHCYVVKATEILKLLEEARAAKKNKLLSDEELGNIIELVKILGDGVVSYSSILLATREAIANRESVADDPAAVGGFRGRINSSDGRDRMDSVIYELYDEMFGQTPDSKSIGAQNSREPSILEVPTGDEIDSPQKSA